MVDYIQMPWNRWNHSYPKNSITHYEFSFWNEATPISSEGGICYDIQQSARPIIEKCGILLPTSVWTHGQLYVALSRCSNKRNLKIYANQDEFIHLQLPPGYYTRNVVYAELFNN